MGIVVDHFCVVLKSVFLLGPHRVTLLDIKGQGFHLIQITTSDCKKEMHKGSK